MLAALRSGFAPDEKSIGTAAWFFSSSRSTPAGSFRRERFKPGLVSRARPRCACRTRPWLATKFKDGMETAQGPRSSDEAGGVFVERSAAEHAPTDPSPANNNNPAQGKHFRRRLLMGALAALLLAIAAVLAVPWVKEALNTVSTDDAYVNGHVTFVAARVPGQVSRVLVDDDNRVRKEISSLNSTGSPMRP